MENTELKVISGPISFKLDKKTRVYFYCICFCGKEIIVLKDSLVKGTKSCGCTSGFKKNQRSSNYIHGMSKTPEFKAWQSAIDRCSNKNLKEYPRYGGRGIKVCARWLESFENFYEDMGVKPFKNMSLDRIDNDGDYSPENCQWATRKEQARNRSSTVFIGKNTLTEEAKKLNITPSGLRYRLKKGIYGAK